MLVLANNSAALLASFSVPAPWTISCHKAVNINFGNTKHLLTALEQPLREWVKVAQTMQQTGKQSRAGSDQDSQTPGCRQRRTEAPGVRGAWRMRPARGIRWRGVMKRKEQGQAADTSAGQKMLLWYSLALCVGASGIFSPSLSLHGRKMKKMPPCRVTVETEEMTYRAS